MNRTWKAIEPNSYGNIMCRDCGRVFDTHTDFISTKDECPSDDCPSKDTHASVAEKGSD